MIRFIVGFCLILGAVEQPQVVDVLAWGAVGLLVMGWGVRGMERRRPWE